MPHWIVTTDIADPRRLRRAARLCERLGQRVQNSVYWMELSDGALFELQSALAEVIEPAHDTVRYYPVCGHDLARSCGEGRCRGLAPLPAHWLI